jgi:hypothetical protein
MPGYFSKPPFLIKGLESSMSSPARKKQLRKATLLPGFKLQPSKATQSVKVTMRRASVAPASSSPRPGTK